MRLDSITENTTDLFDSWLSHTILTAYKNTHINLLINLCLMNVCVFVDSVAWPAKCAVA